MAIIKSIINWETWSPKVVYMQVLLKQCENLGAIYPPDRPQYIFSATLLMLVQVVANRRIENSFMLEVRHTQIPLIVLKHEKKKSKKDTSMTE